MKPEYVDELERIRGESGGMLNPGDVVSAAESPESVLHNCFEWNDQKAGCEYRIWQARMLIRVCVRLVPEGPTEPVRVYVSLKNDRGDCGYRSIVDVMGDDELRAKLLAEAKQDMISFRQKYSILKELANIFEAMVCVG